jgi:hypothetical protein
VLFLVWLSLQQRGAAVNDMVAAAADADAGMKAECPKFDTM